VDAKMEKSEVDDVVLVGGSTRVPRIGEMIKAFFGKEPCRSINPDEAVAHGAAIQAAVLSGSDSASINKLLLLDVTPLSLGIETDGGVMHTLIKRNTTIPCRREQIFSTTEDNQGEVFVQVYEGERARTTDNNLLGMFELTGITPAARGVPQIVVTFDLDVNGILNVFAEEKQSGANTKLTITNDKGRLTKEEVLEMVAAAEKNREGDLAEFERVKAKHGLESYIAQVETMLKSEKFAGLVESKEADELQAKLKETQAFLADCKSSDADTIDDKQRDLEDIVHPLLDKMSGSVEVESSAYADLD